MIGFDGIWRAKNEPDLIIEVKTTDYVTVDLDTQHRYKERLIEAGRATKSASTLIVVGREDTGALEAQIRGSRYAWDMRLIGIDGLSRLVQIKEKSDEISTIRQIRKLLKPFEYTKIDKIIEVIFATTQNVEAQQEIQPSLEEDIGARDSGKQVRTDLELLNAKRQQAVNAFAVSKKVNLIRATTYLTDHGFLSTVSSWTRRRHYSKQSSSTVSLRTFASL